MREIGFFRASRGIFISGRAASFRVRGPEFRGKPRARPRDSAGSFRGICHRPPFAARETVESDRSRVKTWPAVGRPPARLSTRPEGRLAPLLRHYEEKGRNSWRVEVPRAGWEKFLLLILRGAPRGKSGRPEDAAPGTRPLQRKVIRGCLQGQAAGLSASSAARPRLKSP